MKNGTKKHFIYVVIVTVLVIARSCIRENKRNEIIKNYSSKLEQTQSSNTNEPVYLSYDTEGIDEEFTTDGELHEYKFLNKTFLYIDTKDNFKIEKDKNEYFLIANHYNKEDGTYREEKSKLKLYKDVYLVDKNGLGYAYDTKLEKLVFINSKLKIFLVAGEIN